MSMNVCLRCGHTWDGSNFPTCRECWYRDQLTSTSLITDKHNPNKLHIRWRDKRSVVPPEMVNNPEPFLRLLADSGSALERLSRGGTFVVVGIPAGSPAASAVPKWATAPTYAYDSLLVAKAFDPDAHAYGVNGNAITLGLSAGNYAPVSECEVVGCSNQRYPPGKRCVVHCHPPLAR
jgi:hypothetical protein